MRRSILWCALGLTPTHTLGPIYHKPGPLELALSVASVSRHKLRHDAFIVHEALLRQFVHRSNCSLQSRPTHGAAALLQGGFTTNMCGESPGAPEGTEKKRIGSDKPMIEIDDVEPSAE